MSRATSRILELNGLRRTIFVALLALDPWGVARAQLADTIWAGDLTISGISFQQIEEGILKYPTVQGGKFTLPVEIWFWNDGSAWLMFDTLRWGLADRPRFDPMLPRGPGSRRWESTSTYTFNPRTQKGAFRGNSLRLVNSEWNYQGYFLAWRGNFAVSGSKLTVSKMVLGADRLVLITGESEDPRNKPNGIQLTKYPIFGPTLVLQKVVERKPSEAIQGQDWD